jgi:hypothetical protein
VNTTPRVTPTQGKGPRVATKAQKGRLLTAGGYLYSPDVTLNTLLAEHHGVTDDLFPQGTHPVTPKTSKPRKPTNFPATLWWGEHLRDARVLSDLLAEQHNFLHPESAIFPSNGWLEQFELALRVDKVPLPGLTALTCWVPTVTGHVVTPFVLRRELPSFVVDGRFYRFCETTVGAWAAADCRESLKLGHPQRVRGGLHVRPHLANKADTVQWDEVNETL